MKPKIGNIEENKKKIIELYSKSHSEIVVFPELSLTGYIPKDLLLSKKFIQNTQNALNEILPHIGERICIIPMPYFEKNKLYNSSIVLQNRNIISKSFKKHIPNYDIFEEKRYFSSGNSSIFEFGGMKFGLPICEDIWFEDVCMELKNQGADLLIVANASPFDYQKIEKRKKIIEQRFNETQMPIVYVNQVCCQDGILFDGTSFVFDGKNYFFASSFQEDILNVVFNDNCFTAINSTVLQSNEALVLNALIFGLKEYVLLSGFKKVVLGISGGADSALVSVLAVKAFGASNVLGVFMPSQFTSQESFNDAKQLCENLEIEMQTISIQKPLEGFLEILNLEGIAGENIQARIRGNILMAISNQENAMVLTTGNKSEIAVGYCTIYGDMCGGYNPIKDLYKTQVFEMMKYINTKQIAKIPENIITKPPTAELRYNQKDSDSLPKYEILDSILIQLIEQGKLVEEIDNFPVEIVQKIGKLVKNSEHKRNQSTCGTRISVKSFEKSDRKMNIV